MTANYANGVKTTNVYNDERNWLQRVLTRKGGPIIQDVLFTRDAHGQITSVTTANKPEESWSYTEVYPGLDPGTASTGCSPQPTPATRRCRRPSPQLVLGSAQRSPGNAAHNMTSNSRVGAYTYADPAHPHAVILAFAGTGSGRSRNDVRSLPRT